MGFDHHIIEIFKKEAEKCITEMNNLLLKAEKQGGTPEIYKSMKGQVHTLKGDARMLGFESISNAAHSLEDLFALLEKEQGQIDAVLIKNVFAVIDAIDNAVKKVPEETDVINVAGLLEKDKRETPLRTAESSTAQKRETPPSGQKKAKYREENEWSEHKTDVLSLSTQKIDRLIGMSSIFPRYSNRFAYVLSKFDAIKKYIEDQYKDIELFSNFEAIIRDFSHELTFYDLAAKQFQEKINKLKLVPLSSIFDLFPRLVRDIANNTGKKIDFIIEGRNVELDIYVVERLKAILIHMLQNAVDHGCETTKQRIKLGKPEAGRIMLKAFNKGDDVVIEISDDGMGLDVERIRKKAVEKKLLEKEKARALSEDQIIPIIFESGFSTKDVSVYSGRGIGMDVVATTVKKLNGTISVKTVKNVGTIFTISLPLISSYIPITVFTINNNLYGIPSAFIQSTMTVKAADILDTGKQWKVIKRDGMEISLIDLNIFFNLGNPDSEKNKNIILVVNQDEIAGFVVSDILFERKMLIRSTTGMKNKFHTIIGAVLSGKEKVIPVLNIENIFKFLKNGQGTVTKLQRTRDYSKEFGSRKILIVENSLVTRDLIKKILIRRHVMVFEAGNGKEALEYLAQQKINMVITDIEMPVMNGIELIERLKKNKKLQSIPIVVISSYTTYSDKVGKLGVGYFIDKGEFSEAELLVILRKEKILQK
jgi:two-component system chemotaxis sensor kinase CheA